MIYRLSLCALLALAGLGSVLRAEPTVSSFARFHGQRRFDRQHAGRLLVAELNCVACHTTEQPIVEAKSAPNLSDVATRARARHLAKFIAAPGDVKPGTTMPNLFLGQTAAERDAAVQALVHFLVSLQSEGPRTGYSSFGAQRRGKDLYHAVGCVACHGPREMPLAGAQSLGPVQDKYTLPSLAELLRNPLHARPAGRMPSLNLSEREARDIAAYLLPDVPEQPGIEFAYYALDAVNKLPDFSQLTPTATGTAEEFTPGKNAQRDNRFALTYRGELEVKQAGVYRFHVRSDDGSRLSLDGDVVVDNDGVHGAQLKTGEVTLDVGRHDVLVEFFENDGGEELQVEFEGPGVARSSLAEALLHTAPKAELANETFAVDAELAVRGRKLFASLGCAACHTAESPATPLDSRTWASLRPEEGCLAPQPQRGVDYGLSEAQRLAIAGVLKTGFRQLTPKQKVLHTMLQYNCVACHERGGLGGVDPTLNAYFQTTQQEMGVEGSIPPHLDGVGAKLTRTWLTGILENGAKDRPYMLTRMPSFGVKNVGHLASVLEELDATEPLPPVSVERKLAKQAGHRMVGARGFSCIKCHTFGRHRATGVQSIDMTIMTKRLREDWFRQYVRNPQVYRRGTRMPSAWPANGKSLLAEVLGGDSDRQIAAVWTYLRDGVRAKTPAGLSTGKQELVPLEEAIIYRNFIAGAGSRAIGVGYPEGIHLAFDANELRLALIWQGAFIDASRHWTGRGQGYQPPAGSRVLPLVEGPSIAKLPSLESAWPSEPEPGSKFLGYRLTSDQRPTFLYRVGNLTVGRLC